MGTMSGVVIPCDPALANSWEKMGRKIRHRAPRFFPSPLLVKCHAEEGGGYQPNLTHHEDCMDMSSCPQVVVSSPGGKIG